MFGTFGGGGNEGQVDVGGHHAGEVDLGFFRRFFQTLHGHFIAGEVNTVGFFEFVNEIVDDFLVEIVAAEVVVAVGGFYFENAVAQFEDGYVEGAAAEVKYENGAVFAFVETVGKSRRGGFVDDAENFQTGDFTGVFGGLTLSVGEIGGNGNNRLRDGVAEVGFGVGFQFAEDHGRNFLRRIVFAFNMNFVVFTHMSLDGHDGFIGVGHGLSFGDRADEAFTVVGKSDNGRSCSCAFRIGNNDCFAAFHHGYAGVCCT